ncbi:MAG: phosphomethylpyrimidine synthase ThiC [Candidatus Altiarchaeales archaeon]|nr:phosphomethylpyrimidine synthase ThiC [Candidatus Altiarchaeales archaeon]
MDKEVRLLAEREQISLAKFNRNIKSGALVVVKNPQRNVKPLAIGAGASTKVNANIGISPDKSDLDSEIRKAKIAVEAGADTLMDLSVGGDVAQILSEIIKVSDVPLGTVPLYQLFGDKHLDFDFEDYLRVLEQQAKLGVDFMTIHAGLTRDAVEFAKKRVIPITSRGGCFLASWMNKQGLENPLYTGFDDVLEILAEYDVTISLGDGLRPGALADATDKAQITELKTLGRLTKRAWSCGVKVIVEGPGHVPLDQIQHNMRIQKRFCHNAPFYVLGPLVTDIACGYDHITSAIGGAVAAMHGADFLCYVTSAEHLGLPDEYQVREGVIASKIAAHSGDIVKYGARGRDDKLSAARGRLDWDAVLNLCIDPKVRDHYPGLGGERKCTMCGDFCALRIFRDL